MATAGDLRGYFHDAVRRSRAKLHLSLAEHAEFYIVNLLSECRSTERLFAKTNDQFEDLPLALILDRAVHSASLGDRIKNFQRLGDTALFTAGCFPDRAKRGAVDLDYYIRMGGGAYLSLASCYPTSDAFAEIFTELGKKFAQCVDLLAILRKIITEGQQKHSDLLDLYEQWLTTGSEELRILLQKEGIATDHRVKVSQ